MADGLKISQLTQYPGKQLTDVVPFSGGAPYASYSYTVKTLLNLGVTGLTGGGVNLDGVPTVSEQTSQVWNVIAAGNILSPYQLQDSTEATSSPNVIRPLDYTSGAPKVFQILGYKALSYAITGTGGAGYIETVAQNVAPSTPASGFRFYANATHAPAWVSNDGYSRSLASNNTANRIYTLPDASGTIGLTSTTVPSIAGTASQVLVNGGTTGVTGTAITLSLATALVSVNSVTSAAGQNLTLTGEGGASLTLGQGTTGMPSLVGAYPNDGSVYTWARLNNSSSTGKGPTVFDVYNYSDSSRNPVQGWGYNQDAGGNLYVTTEPGVRWNLEGNYDDGSGANKIEGYIQVRNPSTVRSGISTRPFFFGFNRATGYITYVNLKGDVSFRADDDSQEAGTARFDFSGTQFYSHLTAEATTVTDGSVRFDGGLSMARSIVSGGDITAASGALTVGGSARSLASYTTNGALLKVPATVITDTNSSGTIAVNAVNSFGQPNLLRTIAGTYTDSATVYIANAPLANTGVTQTNAWSLLVGAGNSGFGGRIIVRDTSAGTSATTGSGTFAGGIGVAGDSYFGGDITVAGNDITGGAGNLRVSAAGTGQLHLGNNGTNSTQLVIANCAVQVLTLTSNNAQVESGSLLKVLSTTASTTTATGAIIISGGAGIAKSITLGENLTLTSTTAGYIEGFEQGSSPSAPAANGWRLYGKDNGAGKTVLYALFASGAEQQIAIQP